MSFQLNPMQPNNLYIEKTRRIYIDPQYLIQLKSKKKPFKMVASVFQPPQQQEFKNQHSRQNHSNFHSLSKINQNHFLSRDNSVHSKNFDTYSKNSYELQKQMLPHQKMRILQEIMQQQNISPNVEFIWKLLPSVYKKQIINFQEGDCIALNFNSEDKMLILTGQIRIIGINQHSYKKKQGYLMFLSNQTKNKIKEIVVLRSTKILKISNQIYMNILKNYLILKNSQKIKFVKYCPFFIWKSELTEDLATCMELKCTEKEEVIYQSHSTPDAIYFVKEGIVLLERNTKVQNPVIVDYELHYEKNQISEKDTILVVRKGMAFGIDGIIIKEFLHSTISSVLMKQQILLDNQNQFNQLKNANNPEAQSQNKSESELKSTAKRKNSRIYTAKTLGKCELYVLDKKILQTLFTLSDINEQMHIKRKQISSEQLERMSIQYTNMILNQSPDKYVQVSLKKKNIQLKVQNGLYQKSKSAAFLHLQSAPEKKSIQKRKVENYLKKNSKVNSQTNFKINLQKNQMYFDELMEKDQLKDQIKNQRQKQWLINFKKLKIKNIQSKKDQNSSYILPKIMGNKKLVINNSNEGQNIDRKNISKKKCKIEQKLKIEQIINLKIRQQMDSITGPTQSSQVLKKLQKNILNQKVSKSISNNQKQSNEQQQFKPVSKKVPAFISIKSYKSIITPYQIKK